MSLARLEQLLVLRCQRKLAIMAMIELRISQEQSLKEWNTKIAHDQTRHRNLNMFLGNRIRAPIVPTERLTEQFWILSAKSSKGHHRKLNSIEAKSKWRLLTQNSKLRTQRHNPLIKAIDMSTARGMAQAVAAIRLQSHIPVIHTDHRISKWSSRHHPHTLGNTM
jgi:hypothetical protein